MGSGVMIGDHQLGVDVAVAGMAEAGDGNAGRALKLAGTVDEFDRIGLGDHDVPVELGRAGVAQRSVILAQGGRNLLIFRRCLR